MAKGRHRTVIWKQCSRCGKKTLGNQCRCGNDSLKALFSTQYPDKDTVQYENLVAMAATEAREKAGCGLLTGAVILSARFYFAIPVSRAKKLKEGDVHTQRPDLDNALKSVEDGLNKVLWNDDSQVYKIDAGKFWGEIPRAEVTVDGI